VLGRSTPSSASARCLFEKLFGEGGKPEDRKAELRKRASLLDFVKDDLARLERSLGPADRARVSAYLDAVRYTDLQLDVRVFVGPDGTWSHRLLDEDEFEAARAKYAYPDDLVARCYSAVDELIALVEKRAFPFEA